MVSVDTSALADDLAKFKLEAERKLKAMVVGFANDVAYAASEATPVGNLDRYLGLYKLREEQYGIEAAAGFHSGAWRYYEDGSLAFDTEIREHPQMLQYVKSDANSQYKIGDTFYIAARGPAYSFLESGGSPLANDGIMQPAEAAILAAYKSNIYYYYKKG